MKLSMADQTNVIYQPLTPGNWKLFENLFGPRGACGGCWCMNWRLNRKDYENLKGDGNRRALHDIVKTGKPVGVLALSNGNAIGWCAIAPRTDFQRLERSRVLKPVDNQKVWSIVCFYVAPSARKSGLTIGLIKAACQYAASLGASLIEGYPVEPKNKPIAPVFAFTGISHAFRKAGFKEVARNSDTRPIMRLQVK